MHDFITNLRVAFLYYDHKTEKTACHAPPKRIFRVYFGYVPVPSAVKNEGLFLWILPYIVPLTNKNRNGIIKMFNRL
jgi:hypothetical protein